MEAEATAVLKCNECPWEIRRREKDLENPAIMSTDYAVSVHRKTKGHNSYSLDIDDTVTFEVQLVVEGEFELS